MSKTFKAEAKDILFINSLSPSLTFYSFFIQKRKAKRI